MDNKAVTITIIASMLLLSICSGAFALEYSCDPAYLNNGEGAKFSAGSDIDAMALGDFKSNGINELAYAVSKGDENAIYKCSLWTYNMRIDNCNELYPVDGKVTAMAGGDLNNDYPDDLIYVTDRKNRIYRCKDGFYSYDKGGAHAFIITEYPEMGEGVRKEKQVDSTWSFCTNDRWIGNPSYRPYTTSAMAVGDFNGNGVDELIFAKDYAGDKDYIYEADEITSDSFGLKQAALQLKFNKQIESMAVVDLDNNGKEELVIGTTDGIYHCQGGLSNCKAVSGPSGKITAITSYKNTLFYTDGSSIIQCALGEKEPELPKPFPSLNKSITYSQDYSAVPNLWDNAGEHTLTFDYIVNAIKIKACGKRGGEWGCADRKIGLKYYNPIEKEWHSMGKTSWAPYQTTRCRTIEFDVPTPIYKVKAELMDTTGSGADCEYLDKIEVELTYLLSVSDGTRSGNTISKESDSTAKTEKKTTVQKSASTAQKTAVKKDTTPKVEESSSKTAPKTVKKAPPQTTTYSTCYDVPRKQATGDIFTAIVGTPKFPNGCNEKYQEPAKDFTNSAFCGSKNIKDTGFCCFMFCNEKQGKKNSKLGTGSRDYQCSCW
ncbi:MAG: hypothetical protein ABIG20_01820 [archaeon]